MGYFNKFPNFYYDVKGNKNFQVAVDILRRVRINSKAVEGSLFGEYTVKDIDRPDIIAHKLYGDSELHWIILLFNEIHNPYYEWPIPYHEFLQYCENKYPGNAFLLEMHPVKESPLPSVRKRKDHKITEGYHVFGVTGPVTGPYLDTSKSAYVVCWDRTMNKAVVVDENGSFEEDDIVGFAITGGEQATASGKIRRIQLNTEAVHHFEDDLGNRLAPLATYSGLIQNGEEVQKTSTPDHYGRSTILPFDKTLLGAYVTGGTEAQTIKAVTNLEYETNINEKRRQIRLPAPEIVSEIANKFEEILNEEF
jgi:hypothetical protein